jgi:hypothetical protein
MNCMCDFRFYIELMQMICVEKVVLEKSLDDPFKRRHLFTTILVGVQSQVLVPRLE